MVSLSKKFLNCLATLNQTPDEFGIGIADNFRSRLPADLRGEIITMTRKKIVSLSLVELINTLDEYWVLREDQITDTPRTGGRRGHQQGKMFCILCEEEGSHYSTRCPVYPDPQERKHVFDQKHLCYLCGKPNHSVADCSARRCIYKISWDPVVHCNRRHHPALHFFYVNSTSSAIAGGGPQGGGSLQENPLYAQEPEITLGTDAEDED